MANGVYGNAKLMMLLRLPTSNNNNTYYVTLRTSFQAGSQRKQCSTSLPVGTGSRF